MGRRKIKRKIKAIIESLILILLLTAMIYGIFCWIAIIIEFFVPIP